MLQERCQVAPGLGRSGTRERLVFIFGFDGKLNQLAIGASIAHIEMCPTFELVLCHLKVVGVKACWEGLCKAFCEQTIWNANELPTILIRIQREPHCSIWCIDFTDFDHAPSGIVKGDHQVFVKAQPPWNKG